MLCSTGNLLREAGYTALLNAAVEGPAFEWIHHTASVIPQASLDASGLPGELAGKSAAIVSYLRELHQESTGTRRASLVLIGPSGVGKSSLLWRMLHPDTSDKMPSFRATNGFANGAIVAAHVATCNSWCIVKAHQRVV